MSMMDATGARAYGHDSGLEHDDSERTQGVDRLPLS